MGSTLLNEQGWGRDAIERQFAHGEPMPLTRTIIEAAKPQTKTIKLFDCRDLYLEVTPSGGKWWRYKYRIANKEEADFAWRLS